MDSRLLDMFHDPPDQGYLAVRDAVHIDFNCVFEKLVDKDRMVRRRDPGHARKLLERRPVVCDLHGPPSQNVRGTHHNGVSDPGGDLRSFFHAQGGPVLRLLEPEFM